MQEVHDHGTRGHRAGDQGGLGYLAVSCYDVHPGLVLAEVSRLADGPLAVLQEELEPVGHGVPPQSVHELVEVVGRALDVPFFLGPVGIPI